MIQELVKKEIVGRNLATAADEVLLRHQSQGLFTLFRADIRRDKVIRSRYIVKQVESAAMGRVEADGLRVLGEAGCMVPATHGVFESQGKSYLILDFVETGSKRPGQISFEKNMMALYSQKQPHYGWHEDNFIGTLNQINHEHAHFADFWWQDRILPQINLAIEKGFFKGSDRKSLEAMVFRLANEWKLEEFGPRLVHGDLWSGNVIVSTEGHTYFIDPSVAYSHPEQDIAMLQLFGSPFDVNRELYEKLGLPPGTGERIPYFQLYPLLVHVNIFGASYVNGVREVIRKYR
ncbi:MAG: fructosamine kinase family protein [Leptospiraceae bacterium]|nr:fructosamine kinase family protein [Leptospiraceae bacterium]